MKHNARSSRESIRFARISPIPIGWKKTTRTSFHTTLPRHCAMRATLALSCQKNMAALGCGYTEAALMMQAIAESGAAIAGCSCIHVNIFMPGAIRKYGTKEQKERWIPRLITLQDRAAFGVTEPDAGINTTHVKCKAEWDSKRQCYIVSGQKIWTSVARKPTRLCCWSVRHPA